MAVTNPNSAAPGYIVIAHEVGARTPRQRTCPRRRGLLLGDGGPDAAEGQDDWHLDAAKDRRQIQGILIIDDTRCSTYLPPGLAFDAQFYGSNASRNVVQMPRRH